MYVMLQLLRNTSEESSFWSLSPSCRGSVAKFKGRRMIPLQQLFILYELHLSSILAIIANYVPPTALSFLQTLLSAAFSLHK